MIVILKDPITGYNNKLKTATGNIDFVVNSKDNYHNVASPPKKSHTNGDRHFDNLNKPTHKPVILSPPTQLQLSQSLKPNDTPVKLVTCFC